MRLSHMDISAVLVSIEFWFGVATALALEDLSRRALRARLGVTDDSDDESDGN